MYIHMNMLGICGLCSFIPYQDPVRRGGYQVEAIQSPAETTAAVYRTHKGPQRLDIFNILRRTNAPVPTRQ